MELLWSRGRFGTASARARLGGPRFAAVVGRIRRGGRSWWTGHGHDGANTYDGAFTRSRQLSK